MKTEEKVGELLKAKNFSLSTAESCTGGGIAALITSVPGSSEYFKGGIVAYSNEIKADLLHVSVETDRKSTRLNSSHTDSSRMPSSA